MTQDRHNITYDLGMQIRAILGCGLHSDWSITSDGNEECTVLSHFVVADNVLR